MCVGGSILLPLPSKLAKYLHNVPVIVLDPLLPTHARPFAGNGCRRTARTWAPFIVDTQHRESPLALQRTLASPSSRTCWRCRSPRSSSRTRLTMSPWTPPLPREAPRSPRQRRGRGRHLHSPAQLRAQCMLVLRVEMLMTVHGPTRGHRVPRLPIKPT